MNSERQHSTSMKAIKENQRSTPFETLCAKRAMEMHRDDDGVVMEGIIGLRGQAQTLKGAAAVQNFLSPACMSAFPRMLMSPGSGR